MRQIAFTFLLACLVSGVSAFLLCAQQDPGRFLERLKEAEALQAKGSLNRAWVLFDELESELRQEEPSAVLADVLNGKSLLGISLGRYLEAAGLAVESVKISAALGDQRGQAIGNNNAGLAFLYLGDYSRALSFYDRALKLDRDNGDLAGQIYSLNNVGNVHYFEGRYYDALDSYQAALKLLEEASDADWKPSEYRRTMANMAVLFQRLGQNRRALDIYLEMRSGAGTLSPREEAQLVTNLGVLYRHLGDPIKALEAYGEARKLYSKERHSAGELAVLRNTGILLALDLGRLEEAKAVFSEVIELARTRGNRRLIMHGYLYLGEAEWRLLRVGEAFAAFESALSLAGELGSAEEEWKSLFGLGRCAENQGKWELAIQHFEQAIGVIESVRSRLKVSSLTPGFLADKRDVYDHLIRLYLTLDNETIGVSRDATVGKLFELMERARSRFLLDQMKSVLDSRLARSHPETEQRLKELRSELAELWMLQLQSPERKEDLIERYNQLENEFLIVERSNSPQVLEFAVRTPIAIEIRDKLAPTTTLVEYWITDDLLVTLALSRDNVFFTSDRIGPEYGRDLEKCVTGLSQPSGSWLEPCRRVANYFLPQLEATLPGTIESLIIVPDPQIQTLPFGVLPLSSGELLLERFSITYLPSAGFLLKPEDRKTFRLPWETSFAGFGVSMTEAENRSQEGQQSGHTSEEVLAIAATLTGHKELFLGPEATKGKLFEVMAGLVPILHLSTHASVDSNHADRSRIRFAPSKTNSTSEYLFRREVFSLNLHGNELVTLSACETALGQGRPGEGIQSFSSAFLVSGSEATVTSLWRVADRATTELMKQFYYYLGLHYGKAEALRRAQLRLYKSGSRYSHPFFWAAFVLHGNGDLPVSLPVGWSLLVVGFGVLLLMILGLFLFCRRGSH